MNRKLLMVPLLCGAALGAEIPDAPSCSLPEGARFGGLSVSGLRRVLPEVVSREAALKPGDPLSCADLERLKVSLEGLDLFAEVSVSAVPSPADSAAREVRVAVSELPPFLPMPSAKTSDQDGWLLGPSVIALDLFGRDVRLEAHWRATVYPRFWRAQEFLLSESSPWLGPWKIEHELRMVRTDSWNALKEYDERSWELGAEFSRDLWRGFQLLLWAEGFQTEANDAALFGKEGGHDRHGILGTGFLVEKVDRKIDTRDGWRLEGRWGWAGDPFGNVGSWQETLGDLRLWKQPWKRGPIFVGSLLARWRPGEVPFHQLYHQGGANSLRGYGAEADRRSRDELLSTLELRQVLVERRSFRLLGFDLFAAVEGVAGVDAARQGFDADSRGMVGAYGGLHLLLPGLDRLRIEGAWSETDGFALYLGLYEKAVAQRWRSR